VLAVVAQDSGLISKFGHCTKVMLTMSITTAVAERSFSKLIIIKNYMRTTTGQEKVFNLALLSIASKLCENLDFSD
jgi:hypothetical protein